MAWIDKILNRITSHTCYRFRYSYSCAIQVTAVLNDDTALQLYCTNYYAIKLLTYDTRPGAGRTFKGTGGATPPTIQQSTGTTHF